MRAVFHYIDYRKYLSDYLEAQKKKSRRFTLRYFADKTGINSTSFFSRIIAGKRNLTTRTMEKISRAMELSEKEDMYFRHLVIFNQAESSREKQEHYLMLRSLSGSVKETVLKTKQYDYFDKWYTVIIRELICLHDFKDDFAEMARAVTPAIRPLEAKKAVERLLELGLIIRDENGRYVQKDKVITADESITSMAVRSFTDSMLVKAREALHEMEKDLRYISTMTVGVSPSCYDLLKGEIKVFEDRIKAIVESDESSSRVYQFNIQLFPTSTDVNSMNGRPSKAE
jgi:uncharacterized protein (TIGR02147 family)